MKRRSQRGFTLVEVLITCLVLVILFGLILDILIPAGNMLIEGSTKTELQQLAQLSVNQMVAQLNQTPNNGVSLSPTSINGTLSVPMILATNPIFGTDPTSGAPTFQPVLELFWNDPVSGNLYHQEVNQTNPTPQVPLQIDPLTLNLLTTPTSSLRKIAHNVQSFIVTSNPSSGGQVFALNLTLLQNLPGTQRMAEADIYRKVFLRNP